MMKKIIVGMAALVLLFLVACQQTETKPEAAEAWPSQMQNLEQSLNQMIPLIYDRAEFTDTRNEKKIRSGMESFSKSVHDISPDKSQKLVGLDPLFTFTLNRFRGDLNRAVESFDSGHKEYSRSVMKSVVGHCFRCHTRNAVGPEFKGGDLQLSGLRLNRLEKSDLLVASRRFDEALTTLESIVDDSSEARDFPFEVERALRRYLSLMVRVKKEPSRAMTKLDRFLERKAVPYYLLEDTRKWRKSLEAWSGSITTPASNVKDPIVAAKGIIQKARKGQEYRRDHSADTEYLVATSILHDGLTGMKRASQLAEAYFLLGESYEVLGDLGYWNLHEFYFESCVREWPKGPLARKCYERLEESVFVGYSGSSGVHVPFHEKKRLDELKSLIRVDPM